MREAQFLKQNADKWQQYEADVRSNISADILADRFVEMTDDLAYAKTFYPKSKSVKYLNGLAALFHQKIYKNKKEQKGRVWWFWQFELPVLFKQYHKQFFYAFLIFLVFCLMGAISAKYDENFLRLILGDGYVNMTNDNIAKGDPFAVYKHSSSVEMFFSIAFNNIRVAFTSYIMGAFFSVGSLWLLLSNGLMLGSFQYYFISKNLGFKFITVVFIHGTLEIWSLVIAGAAGLILGNSLLFPGTYSRSVSFLRGGKDGLKVVVGLVPLFITAAFFESFVTRHTEMPLALSLSILIGSLAFIIWYFILYPIRLHNKIQKAQTIETKPSTQKNLNTWLNKKLNSEK
ncbi:MAG: stage II sporulation protein M [Chitinophagaceae bacterium]|nr:stage II sporulation protein M [Chitinophagaceae bacterium]